MADEYFKFEFDDTFEEMKQYIKSFKERFDKIVKEELYKFGIHVESIAKELAPVDSGDLEESITSSKVLFEGNEFYITIGTNNEYALRRHEEPESSVNRPKYERGVKYDNYYIKGRGEKTRKKPKVKGFKAGRKYLTNAVKATEDEWNILCERIIARVLEVS